MLYFTSPWLLHNPQFVLLTPFLFFTHSSNPPPTWQPPKCSVYLWVCFCFICLFVLLDSTAKWDHMVFVFFCLTYFPEHNALPVHSCCCRWQDFILFYGWVNSISSLPIGQIHSACWVHSLACCFQGCIVPALRTTGTSPRPSPGDGRQAALDTAPPPPWTIPWRTSLSLRGGVTTSSASSPKRGGLPGHEICRYLI